MIPKVFHCLASYSIVYYWASGIKSVQRSSTSVCVQKRGGEDQGGSNLLNWHAPFKMFKATHLFIIVSTVHTTNLLTIPFAKSLF